MNKFLGWEVSQRKRVCVFNAVCCKRWHRRLQGMPAEAGNCVVEMVIMSRFYSRIHLILLQWRVIDRPYSSCFQNFPFVQKDTLRVHANFKFIRIRSNPVMTIKIHIFFNAIPL